MRKLFLLSIALLFSTAALPVRAEEWVQRAGPFMIEGPFSMEKESYALLIHRKKLPGNVLFPETVTSIEIRNEKGAIDYKKDFSAETGPNGFAEAIEIIPVLIEDSNGEGRGLMLDIYSDPSAPMGGHSVQFFSPKDGKLLPLSAPLTVYGTIYPLPKGKRPASVRLLDDEPHTLSDGRVFWRTGKINVGVWTGYFEVILPVFVNLGLHEIRPVQMKGVFSVRAERRPLDEEETFVRLFPMADENAVPSHIVVRKNTKIEFLEANGRLELRYGEAISIDIEKPWLKVRIHDKEGWVREPEDLLAIGLPAMG